MKIKNYKGTRDFYPENKRIQNYIFNIWKTIALNYGFEEIEGPLIEPLELFTAKSGPEIVSQLYNFKDKSDREVAIRPETTPTIARMIASKPNIQKPIKWFSISRCWRYEQPQSGRLREFFQLNIDILGLTSMQADAEVIATAVNIMQSFNLTKKDFYIRISNRKLIEGLLEDLGLNKNQIKLLFSIIDKKCKISKIEFEQELKKLKLSKEQIKNIDTLFNITDINKIKLKSNLAQEGFDELKELYSYLKYYKVLDFCKLDLTIVRGIDYYTSTVFEVFDPSLQFRAIAGGGRYDNLVDIFSGPKCPGVGYGMGDVVLELFLKKLNKLPKLGRDVDYYVAPVNSKFIKEAIGITEKLRKKYKVELDLMNRNLGKQLEYANSINAKRVIIIGEQDLSKKQITVRDMKSGKEKKVKIKDILKEF